MRWRGGRPLPGSCRGERSTRLLLVVTALRVVRRRLRRPGVPSASAALRRCDPETFRVLQDDGRMDRQDAKDARRLEEPADVPVLPRGVRRVASLPLHFSSPGVPGVLAVSLSAGTRYSLHRVRAPRHSLSLPAAIHPHRPHDLLHHTHVHASQGRCPSCAPAAPCPHSTSAPRRAPAISVPAPIPTRSRLARPDVSPIVTGNLVARRSGFVIVAIHRRPSRPVSSWCADESLITSACIGRDTPCIVCASACIGRDTACIACASACIGRDTPCIVCASACIARDTPCIVCASACIGRDAACIVCASACIARDTPCIVCASACIGRDAACIVCASACIGRDAACIVCPSLGDHDPSRASHDRSSRQPKTPRDSEDPPSL